MTRYDGLPRPVIYAHRGASSLAPENTLAAFRLAVDLGADAVELDTKLSADGQVVVIHDQKVDRTTPGHGRVSSLSLAELGELDAGSWFGPLFAGERIPTLFEVFETVGKRLLFNIEVANYLTPWDGLADRVVEMVQSCGLEEDVIFSSFLPTNLNRVRKHLPGARLGLITHKGLAGRLVDSIFLDSNRQTDSRLMVHPHISSVDELYMQRQRTVGRAVNPWTVNDETQIRRLYALGVEGIITDKPQLARQIRDSA